MLPEQLPYLTQTHKNRFLVRPGLVGYATIKGRASIPWSREFITIYYTYKRKISCLIFIYF